MKPITLEFDHNLGKSLYIQLYDYLRARILSCEIEAGEKLPSLRRLSRDLGISITTVEMAYNQLLVEGYVESRPQSGYYASSVHISSDTLESPTKEVLNIDTYPFEEPAYKYDLSCFDFVKWKKCMAKVFNDHSNLLLFESDPQGEQLLRYEISRYVYTSRGVQCRPEDIVISAGTQQLTNHLCRILRRMHIDHVATEDPGYLPVQNIFADHGFSLTRIPVAEDGIEIERLPVNIASAVYVSPSNQFPTGSVMPIARRYQLLAWAKQNHSIILEDDYDSELRYFGKPVPSLQGLDNAGCVVYFGSFSSTLFPAIKISYMVLPEKMSELFHSIKFDYDQTCSKSEQLTLAMFMEQGYYSTNIRRLRRLYARKLQTVLTVISQAAGDAIRPLNTQSGINIILRVRSALSTELLCQKAKELGIHVKPVANLTHQDTAALIFYYNQIPLSEIESSLKELLIAWEISR